MRYLGPPGKGPCLADSGHDKPTLGKPTHRPQTPTVPDKASVPWGWGVGGGGVGEVRRTVREESPDFPLLIFTILQHDIRTDLCISIPLSPAREG